MNATLETGVAAQTGRPTGRSPARPLLAAALLLAAGAFSVALLLVFTVFVAAIVTYAWSRRVEGPRRAKDRLVTLVIVAAFGLALIPLLSLSSRSPSAASPASASNSSPSRRAARSAAAAPPTRSSAPW